MPHRVLNIDEAVSYLHISRADMERLVKEKGIPFEIQGARLIFRKSQIDAWASQRILGLSSSRLIAFHKESTVKGRDLSAGHRLMPELITQDRIDPEMTSRTKASVLRDMVDLADRTNLVCCKKSLLQSLIERESLCSTALAGGLALLHPRHQDPYMFMDSFMVLGRTIQPVHADSEDGKPTDLFFLICCQDDRTHLHTLARLCTMCRNTSLLQSLHSAADAAEMCRAIYEFEAEVIRKM